MSYCYIDLKQTNYEASITDFKIFASQNFLISDAIT